MSPILHTKRLILREFLLEDAEDMFHLNDDPEVIKYTGDVRFESIDDAAKLIRNYSDYKRNGFGRWSVLLKADNSFIGWCGLKKHPEGFVDIGYRFFKKQWNKGYATEAAKACIEYGFNTLELEEIIGRTAKENKASIRVFEKLNLNFIKYDECEGIENSAFYSLTKEQYNKTK